MDTLDKKKINDSASHKDSDWPVGKTHAWYIFFIVFTLGLFDMVDRQILASLFPYIKAEWDLSDTQLGGLVSIVNISIALFVIPTAYFVDKWSRKKMITIMGTVWSLATGACALANSYTTLFIARAIIGTGEAGYAPASQSLLAASFPSKMRTTALSLATMGMALGAPIGLIAGAYIATHWGWRHAFGVVAIPGFFIALLALFIKDYQTVKVVEDKPKAGVRSHKTKEMFETVAILFKTRTLIAIYVGMTLNFFFGGVMMNWLPSYFNRVAEMPMTQASGMSALVMSVSLIATLCIGPIMDILRRYFKKATICWLAASLTLAGILYVLVFSVFTPGSSGQWVALIAAQLITGTLSPVVSTVIIELAHPGARATGLSLCIFLQNILGFAAGPFIAGILSDVMGLQSAIMTLSFAPVIGGIIFFFGTFTYLKDQAKVAHVETVFE